MDLSKSEELSKISLEDIAVDPHRYGAPTFEEFLQGKYIKYHETEEAKLAMLDNGPNQTRKQVNKIKWVVKGVMCETPEMAQRIAKDENIDLRKYLPELVDIGNHKCDIYLHFNTEKEFRGIIKGS